MQKTIVWRIMFIVVILGVSMLTFSVKPAYSSALVGDVNGDGKVDMKDLSVAGQAFGSYPGHQRWNSQADVNSDDKVDMKDLCLIAKHFGDVLIIKIITATVVICPRALNLRCHGKWITAFIELPEGYSPSDINVSTILLNGTVRAESKPVSIGDYDHDGVNDLMVKFDRQEVIDLIQKSSLCCRKFGYVTLTITGNVNSDIFQGSDTIKVIK